MKTNLTEPPRTNRIAVLPGDRIGPEVLAEAVLLGAMGLPDVRWPDGREMAPQLDLREPLDLYCCLRPVRVYHSADTPLNRYPAGRQIDFVLSRNRRLSYVTSSVFSSGLHPH